MAHCSPPFLGVGVRFGRRVYCDRSLTVHSILPCPECHFFHEPGPILAYYRSISRRNFVGQKQQILINLFRINGPDVSLEKVTIELPESPEKHVFDDPFQPRFWNVMSQAEDFAGTR